MNQPESRLNPHLEAAFQRIRAAAEQAAERGAEGLGLAALSAAFAKRRDALLAAQFVFREHLATFLQEFNASLRRQMAGEQRDKTAAPAKKAWDELSLMDDEQVDAMVAADRIGMAIGHQSEWELRDVESFLAGLSSAEGGLDRNPLRPELIAQALLDGVNAMTDDQEIRQSLIDELTRAFTTEMRSCYTDIAALFRSRGLRQQDLRVRSLNPAGGMAGMGGMNSGPSSVAGDLGGPIGNSRFGGLGPQASGFGGVGGYAQPGYGMPSGGGVQSTFTGGYGQAYGGYAGAGVMGNVDPQLMELLRRLSTLPVPAGGMGGGMGGPGGSGFGGTVSGALPGGMSMSGALAGLQQAGEWGDDTAPGGVYPLPPNLIHLHRDALRQAATGSLDHMVIDVVGSLFDHILSDAKVPPQMARLLAQLQLPVLRAALGDNTFFSSRRHPVRLFVNRLASLACAFDDFSHDPGKSFLVRVRDLVQAVTTGDFDRIDVYTAQLDQLDAFIAEQTRELLTTESIDAAALVERKETDLRLQQLYARQLQQSLTSVKMPDFLRQFLADVWSQAVMQSARDGNAERATRMRQLGRSLVMSVQPKGPAGRQDFLRELPNLMRGLNEGLDLIRWPESPRKDFFAALLPAHAESLKGQAPTALETNLLLKQLDAVFGAATPSEADLQRAGAQAEPVPEAVDVGQRLTPDEAKSLGLVDEAGVNWDGTLDLDLSGNDAPPAPLAAVDISFDELPPAESAPEPASGGSLFEHLQLGVAYEMHTGERWNKVRLAHVSAGRSFFIFTHGSKHKETVTMTARMLKKLCDAGRLRAFEHAALLERATARARKQLAALSAGR